MATINANQLKSFALEISAREIYNDIRSECDVTAILTVRPDATPDLFETFRAGAWAEPILAGTTQQIVATADPDHSEVVWQDISSFSFGPETLLGWGQGACEELGGYWRYSSMLRTSLCSLPQELVDQDVEFEIVHRGDTTCTIELTNNSAYDIRGVWYVQYIAVSPELRYIKQRATNTVSIRKYGRRVMNLPWPLGITPTQMQSLIDNYCERYSEPVSLASMSLEGDTDAKITQILGIRIDDKHEIVHAGLDMTQEFFVNSIAGQFDRDGKGILTGTFSLEEVRDMEGTTFFLINTSLIGGAHVIAP